MTLFSDFIVLIRANECDLFDLVVNSVSLVFQEEHIERPINLNCL
jgi:hypothetical protein